MIVVRSRVFKLSELAKPEVRRELLRLVNPAWDDATCDALQECSQYVTSEAEWLARGGVKE